MELTIFTDGGSRGNPGPAATGVIVKNKKGENVAAYGEYLGKQTNNYAEYSAIISGLKKAKELGADKVNCVVDSKLVEKQLKREWRVKEPTLQKLFMQAWNLMQNFKQVNITHTMREGNKEADAEVNKILDKYAK